MFWVALIALFLVADVAFAMLIGTMIASCRPVHERHHI